MAMSDSYIGSIPRSIEKSLKFLLNITWAPYHAVLKKVLNFPSTLRIRNRQHITLLKFLLKTKCKLTMDKSRVYGRFLKSTNAATPLFVVCSTFKGRCLGASNKAHQLQINSIVYFSCNHLLLISMFLYPQFLLVMIHLIYMCWTACSILIQWLYFH